MEHNLFTFCDRLYNIKLIKAIRKSFTLLIPLIIISMGSYAILTYPVPAFQNFLTSKSGLNLYAYLKILNHASFSYITLILAFLIGYCYNDEAQYPRLYHITLGLTSVLCFVIFSAFEFNNVLPEYFFDYAHKAGQALSFVDFGLSGLLPCLISSSIVCPLYTLIINNFTQLHNKHMSRSIMAVLSTLPPILICFTFFTILQGFLFLFDLSTASIYEKINKYLYDFMLKHADHEYLEAVFFNIIVQILFFLGIHGSFFLYEISGHYYDNVLSDNIYYSMFGTPDQYHIITSTFNNLFVSVGGSGCLLGLLIAIVIKSKNKDNRNLATIAVIPQMFNISEIFTYGIPIIFNPIYFIPFVLAPVVNLTIAYTATKIGFIPVIMEQSQISGIVLISGWNMTHNLRTVIVQAIVLIADIAIYMPFLKIDEAYRDKISVKFIRDIENFIKRNENERERPNFYNLTDDLNQTIQSLIYELRNDIETENLFMVYQPQFDINGKVIGAESLLRWHHEKAGLIYPPLIIALAKEGNFLNKLESFIFKETALMLKDISKITDNTVKISVNVTGRSMADPNFEQMITDSVKKYNIRNDRLWIEVTEQDAIASVEKLEHLKAMGHKIIIDDFGMGHTSIKYLETALFDMVKLDGTLTRDVVTNERNQEIIKSITGLSKKFGMMIVAEFVQSSAQRDKLHSLGCDYFQGSLFSMPVSKELLLAYL